MEFRDLGIDKELLHALSDAGYTVPTRYRSRRFRRLLRARMCSDWRRPVQARPVRLRFRFYKS